MRWINAIAGLSGLAAIVMLVIAAHALHPAPEDLDRIRTAAYLQLFNAAAGLALANRSGRLALISAALMLAGATLFAGALYTLAVAHTRTILMLAPVGGIAMIIGWGISAFSKPAAAA
ncbi:DUF423 domain-containing protein [Terricaulis sp.]|uniref:DUF423 domain-containing protein n=1 Tax=Terricaulis sp. TaxID=2768686 RepID=UPI0037838196